MSSNPLKRFFPDANNTGIEDTYRDFTQIVSSSGDFSKNNNLNTILNSWRNIIMTPRGTYDHDPEYGSDLYKIIMDPLDDYTESRIRQEIINSISRYDNRAIIKVIEIYRDTPTKTFSVVLKSEYEGKEGEITVKITEPTN